MAKRKRKPVAIPRYPVDTEAIRRLALTMPLERLYKLLGCGKTTLYRLLDGAQPRVRRLADTVNGNLARVMASHGLIEVVSAGLNNNANARISVRTDLRGPLSRYLVLRYPLGEIDQRYDATANTLTVWVKRLHLILQRSSFIPNWDDARRDLLNKGLITRLETQPDLAVGCALPHRIVDCYRIDLEQTQWQGLRQNVEQSAKRDDPMLDGRILPSHRFERLHT